MTVVSLVIFLNVSLTRLKKDLQAFQIAENMLNYSILTILIEVSHHSQVGEKWHVFPMDGLSSRHSTIQGYETMNMMRKGQIEGAEKGNIAAQNQFIAELFGLTA